jgi:hypothetical protein
LIHSLYNLVAQADAERLLTALGEDGFVIRPFDGAGVANAHDLWQAAVAQLGIEMVGGWDGFADRMWSALLPDDDEGDRVALVWEHADVLVAGDLRAFLTAFDTLTTIGRQAYEQHIQVLTFYLGEGKNFPALDKL